MVKFVKNMGQFCCFVVLLALASGCARKEQVKVAAGGEATASGNSGVKADADVYEDETPTAPPPPASTQEAPPPPIPAPATTPPSPPAPPQSPPSEKAAVLYAVVEGSDVTVHSGDTFASRRQDMLFFYSQEASSDCGNVQVTGLMVNSRAGICQIAFLPLEQGFKPGQEEQASVTITPRRDAAQVRTWSFRVKAE